MSRPPPPRRWQIETTVLTTALATVSSLLGLFRPGHYNDAQSLLARYYVYVQDLIMLAYAIPVLLVGRWSRSTARSGAGSSGSAPSPL